MNESERLRAAVQDERARRRWAEKELAAEAERAQLWRGRAEDRTARIRLLEERLARQASRSRVSPLKRLVRAMRRGNLKADTSPAPPPPAVPVIDVPEPEEGHAEAGSVGVYPQIRAATLAGADLPMLGELDCVDLFGNADALFDSDLVFVSSSALAAAPSEVDDALAAWIDEVGRQPLVVWHDGEVESPLIAAADCHLAASASFGGAAFSAGFDPSLHNPIGWCPRQPNGVEKAEDGTRVWVDGDQPVVALVTSGGMPHLAAAGVPVLTTQDASTLAVRMGLGAGAEAEDVVAGLTSDADLLARLSVDSVRRAYRTDTAAHRASALLGAAGVKGPRPSPQVAALLISNKPEYVVGAARSMLRQEGVDLHLIIGLHGDGARFEQVRGELDALVRDVSAEILSFDAEVTLGECLNVAAASCPMPVVAKIDDDDWYGPRYLEDALAALEYSRADVVGKARYFVEIEESGDVYLVDGPEEAYSDYVIGSSLVIRRSLWERVRFPVRASRVDSVFLRGVRAAGGVIYSNHHYEFGVVRRASGHTWSVDPSHFAARGSRVGSRLLEVGVDVV